MPSSNPELAKWKRRHANWLRERAERYRAEANDLEILADESLQEAQDLEQGQPGGGAIDNG